MNQVASSNKVFVTGGTGFIGIPLIRSLLDAGHEVTALARDPQKAERETAEFFPTRKPRFVQGDLSNEDDLLHLIEGAEAVFHLAGMISYRSSDRKKMEALHIQGTRNLADACIRARVKRLVHVSSIVAVGVSWDPEKPLNEDSTYNADNLGIAYFDTKRQAEAEVHAAIERGLDAVIVNPATVVGKISEAGREGNVNRSLQGLARAPFNLPGGNCWVDVVDIVSGICLAWSKGKRGSRYILGSENIAYAELIRKIREHSHKTAPRFTLNSGLLHSAARAARFAEKIGAPVQSQLLTRISGFYMYYDTSRARQELGWTPRSPWPAILEMAEASRS